MTHYWEYVYRHDLVFKNQFLFICSWAKPGGTQGLPLSFPSEFTPGRVEEWNAKDGSWVSSLRGKCPTCCAPPKSTFIMIQYRFYLWKYDWLQNVIFFKITIANLHSILLWRLVIAFSLYHHTSVIPFTLLKKNTARRKTFLLSFVQNTLGLSFRWRAFARKGS